MKKTKNISNERSSSRSFPRIAFGFTWLILLPGLVWGILGYYLPLLGGTLNRTGMWIVTISCLLLAIVSLICHILAHLAAAWLTGKKLPSDMTLLIFGDAAQRWPTAGTKWREALIAGAGPLVNLLLAGLAYLVWNTQTNNIVGLTALFLCGFNGWLYVINLIPTFPFDGGRLIRAILQDVTPQTFKVTRWVRLPGMVLAAALTGWGIFLILQHSRFSWETGLTTFLFVLILMDGVRLRPAIEPPQPNRNIKYRFGRILVSILLGLVMLAVASSLLLTNNGLDAPGVALSIEPMIQVPDQYRHPIAGQFFLVTVISQAPITAGEWVLGKVDPADQVVPPEQVTPKNTTPQQQARQDYQMLDTSETTAIAVGLQLAGYSTVLVGKGVQVDSILPGSHANGILQVGDVIISLNGKPVQTSNDLINLVGAQNTQDPIRLQVKRGRAELQVEVPLMPPASTNSGPKIGIQIQTAGFDYQPPFPISIETNKISGGPSAGLMFTLAVYNTLTPINLTGGRRIAGTGTINLDGSVGPIGGVKQKIFAAEAVGATYFLCPVENYADAVSVARSIKVVKIATVEQAVDFLRSLPAQ